MEKKRGGNRKGAGRKKGSKNKVLAELQAAMIKAGASDIITKGVSPLEFLLKVCRGEVPETTLSIQVDAAKAAAPYLHKKMPTEIDGKFSGTLLCKWQD